MRTVLILLDIDHTLLSACRRFSALYPLSPSLTRRVELRYDDLERGRFVSNCTLTLRPHLDSFLRVLSGDLCTARVAVQLGLFTHNTESYARAVAANVLAPFLRTPLSVTMGRAKCGPDGQTKPLFAGGRPATSLLLDDRMASFVTDEFFSGRGALVRPFFTGHRVWGAEEEMDTVLSCEARREMDGGPTLCALVKEFVAFWHDYSGDVANDGVVHLLRDECAERYQSCWNAYHAPMEDRLWCMAGNAVNTQKGSDSSPFFSQS